MCSRKSEERSTRGTGQPSVLQGVIITVLKLIVGQVIHAYNLIIMRPFHNAAQSNTTQCDATRISNAEARDTQTYHVFSQEAARNQRQWCKSWPEYRRGPRRVFRHSCHGVGLRETTICLNLWLDRFFDSDSITLIRILTLYRYRPILS